jgi:Icc protein
MKRLAWATDIHLNFLRQEGVLAFCDALAREAPDALLLTGDLAESHDLEQHLQTLERRLARPIYFVLGNHDFYRSGIAAVRERVARLCEGSRFLRWMNREGVIELTPETGLVGHDAWADGRNGDYFGSPLLFRDWVVIDELRGLGPEARLAALGALGDEAAAHLERLLPQAFACFRRVVVLTHVPPFAEACLYKGHITADTWLPHLSCRAVGDVLRRVMAERPDRQMLVLSGHTHQPADVDILPNLRVRVGAAEYGAPRLAEVIVVA